MKLIYRCEFGSKVYGTNLPTSDSDYKGIFIPSGKDLVLQRAAKHVDNNTKTDSNIKNTSTDIDDESYSIQEYFKLLTEGQTVCLDMFFTPDNKVLQSTPEWAIIKSYKDKYLHKGTAAFVGYTRAQAAKYGIKGFRVAAVVDAIELIKNIYLPDLRLQDESELLINHVKLLNNKYINIVSISGAQGVTELALEVCDRKIPLHSKASYTILVLERIYENYGERARLAQKNEGIDWKALMHAVRVAHEAKELLLTANITFPRPEAELLLKIRKGEMPYKEVAEIIEQGLVEVELAKEKSTLPEKPDYKFIDDMVYSLHLEAIKNVQD